MEQSRQHHYVARWYQKRFLPAGQTKLYYLDLKPKTVVNGRVTYTVKDLHFWDPARCFWAEDIYAMKFGKQTTDVMEKRFFGNVDRNGAAAVDYFRGYEDIDDRANDAVLHLVDYIGAQRFRTPRGLDWVQARIGSSDRTSTLLALQQLFQAYAAMWMEGIWEIVHARESAAKFIVTDEPVTFFNRAIFPAEAPYPGGEDFPKIGTRTLFPLSMDACLIITHLQLVRNPWTKPLAMRENARTFGRTMFKITEIQFGRELDDTEVLKINHILKQHASKYIAAANKEALYPEKQIGAVSWSKLDDDWFLLPNPWKVGFTGGFAMGFKDGRTFAMDEYGRRPGHPHYENKKQQDKEFRTFHNAQQEWAKKRFRKRLSRVVNQLSEDSVSNSLMQKYLVREGLLAKEDVADA